MTDDADREFLPNTAEGWDAWHYLKQPQPWRRACYSAYGIRALIEELVEIVNATIHVMREYNVPVSIFSGQNDRVPPDSENTATYVLDHLLACLDECQPLVELFSRVKPKDFIALLTLLADQDGDQEGLIRAHYIMNQEGGPYVGQIEDYFARMRRRRGGIKGGETRRNDVAHKNERARAITKRMLREGASRTEIYVALRTSDGRSQKQLGRVVSDLFKEKRT